MAAEVDLSEIDLEYKIEEAAQKAFDVGRKGNIFERLSEIFNTSREGVRLSLEYSYNLGKVNEIIDDFYSKTLIIPCTKNVCSHIYTLNLHAYQNH